MTNITNKHLETYYHRRPFADEAHFEWRMGHAPKIMPSMEIIIPVNLLRGMF